MSTTPKRRKPSAWPSILSLAAVMFMLGLLSVTVIGFKGLSIHLMESSSIDIYFKDSISRDQVSALQLNIGKQEWVKATNYVSPEQGIKEMQQKYDPEFLSYAETVSLPMSIEVFPKASFANIEFIDKKAKELRQNPIVESVVFQRNWVENMTHNVKMLQYAFGGITIILLLIAIVLIQSATRMSIFANRFLIKSMQFIGATNGFIIKPYIYNFLRYAAVAIPISSGFLIVIFYVLPIEMLRSFTQYIQVEEFAIICGAVSVFGVILAVIGSWLSTVKYLNSKIENLY